MKSEQFKLTLSLDSSCGGYIGDNLEHVVIMSKQQQIFLKVFSVLASTSMCAGLGKINKSHVRFVVGMIPYLDSPSDI